MRGTTAILSILLTVSCIAWGEGDASPYDTAAALASQLSNRSASTATSSFQRRIFQMNSSSGGQAASANSSSAASTKDSSSGSQTSAAQAPTQLNPTSPPVDSSSQSSSETSEIADLSNQYSINMSQAYSSGAQSGVTSVNSIITGIASGLGQELVLLSEEGQAYENPRPPPAATTKPAAKPKSGLAVHQVQNNDSSPAISGSN